MIGKAVVKFASDFAYAFNINFTFVSEGDMKQASKTDGVPVLFLLKCLLFAYALTGALLMLLSLLLFKAGLGEKTVSVAIIVIYGRKEDEKPEICLGIVGRNFLFSDSGCHFFRCGGRCRDFRKFLFYNACALLRRGNAGRNAQLTG